jgi:transketolase
MNLPQLASPLSSEQLSFLKAFSKSCRRSILKMLVNAGSGHPGGSLSSLDFLALIYAMRVCETNEPVIISHGHISPAVYAVLAELGVIPKDRLIENLRKAHDIFEGHVARHVEGVHYGTGPLGVGGSVASGVALADQLEKSDDLMFLMMGDGEQQEGQVYEMINFAAKYKLGNLINFIDYNQVQLTDSLDETMPTNIHGFYEAAGWHVIECDGHDFEAMWDAIGQAAAVKDKPSVIIGKTVMGKGVEYMEKDGRDLKSNWHGNPPKKDDAENALKDIELNPEELAILDAGLKELPKNIKTLDVKNDVKIGTARNYEEATACRAAYGNALLDLAKENSKLVALTADLAGSVKTAVMGKEFPERHIECGIAEQHMVSCSGGFALRGFLPFCSTFGAFMSSRAKDQARVNDLNKSNVKMVATHCGLDVGADGPTHQAIDDIGSFLGFMHTKVLEPCDANQCDRMIRTIAKEHGNFYVRMGRSALPIITDENGRAAFDGDYNFEIGKAEVLRRGARATIVASGPMVARALEAAENLSGNIEVIAVSSFIPFDEETIVESAKKTGKIVTVHDHHKRNGLGCLVLGSLNKAKVEAEVKVLGVDEYQLSGNPDDLYKNVGLGVEDIVNAVKTFS